MNRLATILAAACVVAGPVRTAAQRPAAVQHLNPAWSPDERTIVFESNRDGKTNIYSVALDGSNLTRLTTLDSESSQPAFSPDGQHIAFGSTRDGHGQIYIMTADGSGVRRVTNTPSGMHFLPSFSPDGTMITFGVQKPPRRDIYYIAVVRTDGTGYRELTDSTHSSEAPAWTRDGRIGFLRTDIMQPNPGEPIREFIVRRSKTETYISVRPDGSDMRTGAKRPAEADDGAVTSPTGRWSAFSKPAAGGTDLYIRDLNSGAERLLIGVSR
jgi:Tol biopolymer transport system component